MHTKFHLNMTKNFFTVQVTKHWNRRYSRMTWIPTLCSGMTALAGREIGPEELRSLPILPILWFCGLAKWVSHSTSLSTIKELLALSPFVINSIALWCVVVGERTAKSRQLRNYISDIWNNSFSACGHTKIFHNLYSAHMACFLYEK